MQGWRKDWALLTGVVGTGYQSHNDKGLTVMAMKLWTSFCDGIDWVILNQLGGIYLFHPSRPPDPCHFWGPPKAWRLHINEGWFRSLVNHHLPGWNCCFMGWYIPAHPRYAPLKSYLSHIVHRIFDKITDNFTIDLPMLGYTLYAVSWNAGPGEVFHQQVINLFMRKPMVLGYPNEKHPVRLILPSKWPCSSNIHGSSQCCAEPLEL